MKKVLAFVFSLACCVCLFTGCFNSYVPEGSGGGSSGNNNGGNGNGDGAFTVRLACDGRAYNPQIPMSALWYNGASLTTAEFKDGVATVYGLDGDYQVTLSDIPDGYAYNPNINFATNRKKDVTIELLPLINYYGAGTGWGSSAYRLISEGAYCVTFTEAGQKICCSFNPSSSGVYVIESIVNTTTNEVNPRLEDYGQNTAGWTPSLPYETCKDGGASSAYTRNFKYSAQIDSDCINFAVRCDSRVDYPVKVYFTIQFADNYSRNPTYTMVVPKQLYDEEGNFNASPSASGTFIKCGQEAGNTNHILDGSKFALGEDGYYHYKDGDALTSSIVYADLSTFVGERLEESASGTHYVPTNLKVGLSDYTLFVKGWEGLKTTYGVEANIPDKYQEYKDNKGYADASFKDNMCAVNEELRAFLKAYSADRRFFFDGLGSAEHEGYNSTDDDQWLYFCGYYI